MLDDLRLTYTVCTPPQKKEPAIMTSPYLSAVFVAETIRDISKVIVQTFDLPPSGFVVGLGVYCGGGRACMSGLVLDES